MYTVYISTSTSSNEVSPCIYITSLSLTSQAWHHKTDKSTQLPSCYASTARVIRDLHICHWSGCEMLQNCCYISNLTHVMASAATKCLGVLKGFDWHWQPNILSKLPDRLHFHACSCTCTQTVHGNHIMQVHRLAPSGVLLSFDVASGMYWNLDCTTSSPFSRRHTW